MHNNKQNKQHSKAGAQQQQCNLSKHFKLFYTLTMSIYNIY